MTTNVLFATASKMVENLETLNGVYNNDTATAAGLEIILEWTANDCKTARRGIYDICRMLRGEINAGRTAAAIPAEIAAAVAGKKLTKSNTDFCTAKNNGDGVLSIDMDDFHAYCWRAVAPVENPAKSEKTAKSVEFRCKNIPANRAALTNAAILYTDNGEVLTFTTDSKTLKFLKIKTIK